MKRIATRIYARRNRRFNEVNPQNFVKREATRICARRNRRFNEINALNFMKREATQKMRPAGFCAFS
jgi:hypothetical protein